MKHYYYLIFVYLINISDTKANNMLELSINNENYFENITGSSQRMSIEVFNTVRTSPVQNTFIQFKGYAYLLKNKHYLSISDAYLQYNNKQKTISFGRQHINWGNGNLWNPINLFFNDEDYNLKTRHYTPLGFEKGKTLLSYSQTLDFGEFSLYWSPSSQNYYGEKITDHQLASSFSGTYYNTDIQLVSLIQTNKKQDGWLKLGGNITFPYGQNSYSFQIQHSLNNIISTQPENNHGYDTTSLLFSATSTINENNLFTLDHYYHTKTLTQSSYYKPYSYSHHWTRISHLYIPVFNRVNNMIGIIYGWTDRSTQLFNTLDIILTPNSMLKLKFSTNKFSANNSEFIRFRNQHEVTTSIHCNFY